LIVESLEVAPFQTNCYVVASRPQSSAIIIDPGGDEQKIRGVLEKHRLTPAAVVNTHGHIDHIGCDDVFGVPIYIHRQDLKYLNDPELNLSHFLSSPQTVGSSIKSVEEGDLITVDDIELAVIHTPGHTPGGMCLLMKKPAAKILFSGDTLFYLGIGRTDFPGGQEAKLISSIKEKLLCLSDDTVVYPGHGPSSTIGKERKRNPFLA
jgi:hydroxyacylglutathione hydrolase